MKNEKLIAAREFLAQAGFNVPDDVIIGLFDAVKGKRVAIYDVGDFVYFGMGMGEAGHGTVTKVEPNGYRVAMWSPEVEQVKDLLPNYTEKYDWAADAHVGSGDMFRLSNEEEALDYWLVRSGVKR